MSFLMGDSAYTCFCQNPGRTAVQLSGNYHDFIDVLNFLFFLILFRRVLPTVDAYVLKLVEYVACIPIVFTLIIRAVNLFNCLIEYDNLRAYVQTQNSSLNTYNCTGFEKYVYQVRLQVW